MASLVSQSRVSIAQLNPNLESADHSSVHGIVTLIWPYNSLTQSLSLLLVEPDFRLRRHQGQVRLQFLGSSAKAVTKAGISSGDELALSLQGASWEKDVETANTPGRGIAWKVTFGERVVFETRHPGQASRVLDIDHPPPSPELSQKASSPPGPPLYNSHIPTSSGKPKFAVSNDDYPTWSSPAFLKRSHFALSSYDPFADLDDEFADNNRKKRTKFGHGSGQWKFIGNTPSPEREDEDVTNRERSSSPSKAVQVDDRQADGQTAMLAIPPVEISDDKTDATSADPGAPESPHLKDEIASNHSNVRDDDAVDPGATVEGMLGDRLPPVDIGEAVELEDNVDETASSAKIADQKTINSPSEVVISQQTSSSVISSEGHSPASSLDNSESNGPTRDSESNVFWSQSASAFGLDGSAISKVNQAANIAPMANEIGRRWVEMQRRVNRSDVTGPTNQVPASTPSVGLHDKATPEASHVSQDSSHEAEAAMPLAFGAPKPTVNQSAEATETSQTYSSDAKEYSENASLDNVEKDQTDGTSLTQSTQHEDSDRATQESYIQIPATTSLENINEVKEPTISTQSTQNGPIIVDNPNDQDDLLHATIQEPASPSEALTVNSPASRTTDINVRTDEGQDKYQPPSDSAEEMLEHALTSIDGNQKIDDLHQTDDIPEQKKLSVKAPTVAKKKDLSDDSETESKSLEDDYVVQEKNDSTSENNLPMDVKQTPDSVGSPKALEETVSDGDVEEGTLNSKMLSNMAIQDSATDTENLPSQRQFPSTIPDTFADSFTNQLITGAEAEQIGIFSQASAPSVPPKTDDKTTSEPDLIPKTTGSESLDEVPHRIPVSEVSVAQEPAEVHDVRKTLVSTLDSEKLNKMAEAEIEPGITAPSPALSQSSLAQLDKENSAPANVKKGRDGSRESSLITRLKELRRQSDQMGLERLSSNSASPWFTPRRPSLVASDKAEEEPITTTRPTEQAKSIATMTPTKDTTEKVESRLSESFIRSSPPKSPQSPGALPQESQYIPSSQQTTGFRTSLSYFVPVTSLHCHYGTSVDVLAVAISSTPVSRAPSGPKDHNQSIYLTDPSSTLSKNPNSLTTAQIFRPYRTKKESLECFPSIQPGDAILLRDFKVQSFQKSLSLISTDSSAWAVFRKGAEVSIPGPPVEFGPEERAFARALWDWWSSLEPEQSASLLAAVPKPKAGGAKKTSTKKGLGFDLPSSQAKKGAKNSESSDNSIPISARQRSTGLESSPEPDMNEEGGGKAKTPEPQRRVLRPRKARGMASATPEKDTVPEVEEIHELRDGTRYVDREGVGVKDVEMANGIHDLRDGTRYRDRLRK